MHAAPAVRVDLGRSRGWVLSVGLLCFAAVAQATAWLLLHRQWPFAGPAALVAGVVAGVFGAQAAWRSRSPGVLAWDGVQWHWAEQAGEVAVMLDFGGWLMLRFRGADAGPPTWIAASRGSAAGSWGALRAALYSPRPADLSDVPPA